MRIPVIKTNQTNRCPDCAAPTTAGSTDHEPTCPLWLAADRVSQDDRAWLDAHPDAPWRWRPITPAETAQLRLAGLADPDADLNGWKVCVRRVNPGVRVRRFVPPRGLR